MTATPGPHHAPPTPAKPATESTCYLTTPIYYVNDRPHIGHCYTSVLADILARFERLRRGDRFLAAGKSFHPDVFFLTGTDEHADKVVTSAAAHNVSPQAWADQNAEAFKQAFAFMNIAHDDFIRTTEPRHKDKVIRYITALMESGDIYKGQYTGWYDEGQEEYVTETAARDANFKSAISGRPLVKRTEDCYFFRLSKYQDQLCALIEGGSGYPHYKDGITREPGFAVRPDARCSEVLGRIRRPAVLNDVPVSRPVTSDPATQWGIRVPGDDANRIYVWIDALFNYLSTVDTPERRKFWPATVHLIGKDILWFHAVIWPALLLALRASSDEYRWVRLPRMVFGHGWWVSEGQKMSKSLGNFIDLEKLQAYAGKYSLDALRWYLATQGPLAGNDADFSHAKFVEVFNADLANGLGNCVSRVSNMIEKYFEGKMPPPGRDDPTFNGPGLASSSLRAIEIALTDADVGECLLPGIQIVRKVDAYIAQTRPFTLAKDMTANAQQVAAILANCAEALRIASILLSPAMPQKCAAIWKAWDCEPAIAPLSDLATFNGPHALRPGQKLSKPENLFMRADPAEAAPQ